ncbi:hypothetical protein EHYA_01598 [Embleya hyalina]|uniref:Uncharacterized protein n=1 Tax=Embleya hyalina TaxID=516124 RepID=A0A401YH76_9ACTN|nr:hypothetical protein EHYA_01598 [Embleya hyalina]
MYDVPPRGGRVPGAGDVPVADVPVRSFGALTGNPRPVRPS